VASFQPNWSVIAAAKFLATGRRYLIIFSWRAAKLRARSIKILRPQ
jgi:hypothetical protein